MAEKSELLADFLTKEELAAEFGVTPRTIDNWIKAGLPFIKLGGRRFRIETTRHWITSLETHKSRTPSRRRAALRKVGSAASSDCR